MKKGHTKIFNDLSTDILEDVHISTGSGRFFDVMSKTKSAVRGIEKFILICCTSPKELQAVR